MVNILTKSFLKASMIKPLLTIVDIVLLTLAIYVGVIFFYKVTTEKLDGIQPAAITTQQISNIENKNIHPFSYYNSIEERNLFNAKKEAEASPEHINIETLEQTKLKVKLLGTVKGNQNNSYAVMEGPEGNKQNLYRVGDAIDMAKVKLILNEKVVLSVDGRDEILGIEKPESGKISMRYPPAAAIPSSQKITLKRSDIDTAFKNANMLMKQVKIRPHFKNNTPDGFILTGIKSKSLFKKMGLRNGDIIAGVNGNKIESMDDTMKFYENFKSSSSVKLQIKRRGRHRTIDYNIE